jgi:hypothetical protein
LNGTLKGHAVSLFSQAVREFMETGAIRYRKIVDTSGVTTDLPRERLDAIVAFMCNGPRAATHGPLAFVIDPARRWLDEMLKVEAKR